MLASSSSGLLIAAVAASHDRVALPAHDRSHVGEVDVDLTGLRDQIADPLDCLPQHIIGDEKCLRDRGLFVDDLQQMLIRNNNERVYRATEPCETLVGETHLVVSFEVKGLGHDRYGQNAHIASNLRDHRRCARTRTATHTRGDEYHVGALNDALDLTLVLERGLFADFGLATGSEPPGQLGAERQTHFGVRPLQRLQVGIDRAELDVLQSGGDHAVHRVASATTDTDYLYDRGTPVGFAQYPRVIVNFDLHIPSQ